MKEIVHGFYDREERGVGFEDLAQRRAASSAAGVPESLTSRRSAQRRSRWRVVSLASREPVRKQ